MNRDGLLEIENVRPEFAHFTKCLLFAIIRNSHICLQKERSYTMSYIQRSIIILLSCLVLCLPSSAEDIDWTNPESIDIYDETISDFLGTDTDEFMKAAGEAYNAGEWEKAAQYYLAVVKYNPGDGASVYNLACCYGLLGEAELAGIFVEKAYNAGFESVDHITWDPDFEKVRGETVFDDAVKNIAADAKEKGEAMGDLLFFDAPAYFECRIHLPENYDPSKSYPLIVGLHGYGSNHERFITLWEKFAGRDFIYASPQAPYPFSVGSGVGYSWMKWIPDQKFMTDHAIRMTERYIAGVVKGLKFKYNVSETYLMGFSQGCGFTYMAGIKNHELFNGLICFGGWLDIDWLDDEDIRAANELRVFIAHGNEDRMVDFESGITARDYLIDMDYDVTFYEFDGAHSVPEEALQATEEWMRE